MRTEIPLEGTQAAYDGRKMSVKGPKGSVERQLWHPVVGIKVEADKVVLTTKGDKRRDKRVINTIESHITNMIIGVKQGFRYNMSLIQSHFPVQIKVDGNNFVVENFFGEKVPRKVAIPAGVKVTANSKDKKVTIESSDIEMAGLLVTRIEQTTRAVGKDRRIFQDGIYLVNRELITEEKK